MTGEESPWCEYICTNTQFIESTVILLRFWSLSVRAAAAGFKQKNDFWSTSMNFFQVQVPSSSGFRFKIDKIFLLMVFSWAKSNRCQLNTGFIVVFVFFCSLLSYSLKVKVFPFLANGLVSVKWLNVRFINWFTVWGKINKSIDKTWLKQCSGRRTDKECRVDWISSYYFTDRRRSRVKHGIMNGF